MNPPRFRPFPWPGAALLLASAPLHAGVLHVDAASPGPVSPYNSWATAAATLQDALAVATSGDEIWLAQGTYHPDEGAGQTDDDRSSTFALTDDLAIYGGFPTGGGLFNSRNSAAFPTILSGDIGVAEDDTDNAYHVVLISDGDDLVFQDVVLDGLTITGGHANLNDGNGHHQAGGIDNRENLTLQNVTVTGNYALGMGGGLVLRLGSSQLLNSSFTDNESGDTDAIGGGGGALIARSGSEFTAEHCMFLQNHSAERGGALSVETNNATFISCSFSGNEAGNEGGGVVNTSSSPTFTNCSFSGNHAASGGGIFNGVCSPALINCSFSGNRANTFGGGMYNSSSSPTLTNCLIWNNSSFNTTSSASASVYNLLIGTPTYSHCLIHNINPPGTGNLDGTNPANNPLFVAGINPATAPTTGGDLRLFTGSPALDAGDNAANFQPLDIAGNTRIQNGTIDLGAYEGNVDFTFALLYPALLPEDDANANGLTNFTDYALGADPTAPHDPSVVPQLSGTQLTFGYRANAADVNVQIRKSTDLQLWLGMVEGVDYTINATSTSGGRTELTLDLLIGPPADPSLFFREEFHP